MVSIYVVVLMVRRLRMEFVKLFLIVVRMLWIMDMVNVNVMFLV